MPAVQDRPRLTHRWQHRLTVLLATALLLAGCASLPPQDGRVGTYAVTPADTASTLLARTMAPMLSAHPGQSGFYPLASGPDALVARIALARAAQRTLDVQYYIYDGDLTGKTLLANIIAAADRGVRVRLLLDDLHVAGQDRILSALDDHPNIEVRLFNPFASRSLRMAAMALDYSRLNRRMHNKSMTADNQLTIVGGRNIGDAYFSADKGSDFTDLDLLLAGPVVPEVSAVFDDYWNGAAAYPVSALVKPPEDAAAQLQALRDYLDKHVAEARGGEYSQTLLSSGLAQALESGKLPAYWGQATVIADKAAKVTLPPEDDSSHAIPKLVKLLGSAQQELALVSPYFVPNRKAVEWFAQMTQRGVTVRILTNSFAATDVSAVHAGYSPWRKNLLEAGVELYELKPSAYAEMAREGKQGHRSMVSKSRASLHAKSYMVDRRLLFVGSLNLDPRSARLNTEMGVVVDSAPLCVALGKDLDQALLDVAYKVMLAPDADGSGSHLVWVTRENGLLRTYDSEPDMGALQHLGQGLLRMLPIEEEL